MVKSSHEVDCCLMREECCPPCPPACSLPEKHCKECFTKCDLKFAGVCGCPTPFARGFDVTFSDNDIYNRDLSIDPCHTVLKKNPWACTNLHYCARVQSGLTTDCVTMQLVEIDRRGAKCGCDKPKEKILKEAKCVAFSACLTDCCLDWVGEVCPHPCVVYVIRFIGGSTTSISLESDMGHVTVCPKKRDQKRIIACGLNQHAKDTFKQYKPAKCLKNAKPRTQYPCVEANNLLNMR